MYPSECGSRPEQVSEIRGSPACYIALPAGGHAAFSAIQRVGTFVGCNRAEIRPLKEISRLSWIAPTKYAQNEGPAALVVSRDSRKLVP